MLFPHFNDYNARKVSTTPDHLDNTTRNFRDSAPSWFRWEVGFRFIYDKSPVILLGFGGYRNVDDDLQLTLLPPGIIYAYHYKGEWHLSDMTRESDWDWSWMHPDNKEPSR